jgi:intraflagellar transport protein 140
MNFISRFGMIQVKEAIAYYSQAKCFSHAMRLAKDYKLDNELMHLALQGSPEQMIDAARYYEGNPKHFDKAVTLFAKGGAVSKALDICFKTQQFESLKNIGAWCKRLESIPKRRHNLFLSRRSLFCRTDTLSDLLPSAEDLGENTDPKLLDKCATFFLDHGQFEKAMHLYVKAKRNSEVRCAFEL